MTEYSSVERIKEAISQLPRISEGLPGIVGTLKVEPAHFQVKEVLPYQPCGEGEHVFVSLRRSGWNTPDVAHALARACGCRAQDVGWGGRKDKQAITTQTFSMRLPMDMGYAEIERRLIPLPFEFLSLTRHRNKIKTGHVAGNHFRILISQTPAHALERTRPIIQHLTAWGVPNYFGPQRFGRGLSNLDRVGGLLESHQRIRGRRDLFWISSLQSALFNLWLKERIQRGDYDKILDGDVARKTDTGGMFVVTDPDEARERFDRALITYTGPIYGYKLMQASGRAGRYESELLNRYGLDLPRFKPLRSPGSRRLAVLKGIDFQVTPDDGGIWFEFSLPSGAYATTVMREFMPDLPTVDGI